MTAALHLVVWFHREPRPPRGPDWRRTSTGWTRGRRVLLDAQAALELFEHHRAQALEHAGEGNEGDDRDQDLACSFTELLRVVPADLPLLELLAAALEAPHDYHLDRGAWWADLQLVRSWYGLTARKRGDHGW